MLKQRLITAAILVPIFVLCILKFSPRAFGYLTLIFVMIGAWEWSSFMGIREIRFRLYYPALVFITLPMSLLMPTAPLLIATAVWWFLACVLVVLYPKASNTWGRGLFFRGLMGLFVLMPTWRALNFLRDIDPHTGPYLVLFLFVLIWGADSGAYFAGKKWGTHKLAPKVSPGKTWQGLAGALVVTSLITMLSLCFMYPLSKKWLAVLLLSLVTVLASVLGDLFESMLKRNVGLKDSGHLFPGHGGLMDRIDSLTAAAPIFALGCLLM